MKIGKIISTVLASVFLISCIAGCGESVGGDYKESKAGTKNTLTGKTEEMTVEVIENKLYITHLGTLKSKANMVTENSEYSLPVYGIVNDKQVELKWEYVSAMKFTNKVVNDAYVSGVVYNFKETAQNLELKVYFNVRPELSGPFEVYMELENQNSSDFRIEPRDFASVSVATPDEEKVSVVKFAKESLSAEGKGSGSIKGTGIYVTEVSTLKRSVLSKSIPSSAGNGYDLLAQYIDRTDDGVLLALGWSEGTVETSKEDGNVKTVINFDFSNTLGGSEFTTKIPAGTVFEFPPVYILPYDGSIDDGANIFKSWFFDCKVVKILRKNESIPYTQTDGDFGSIENALKYGLESVKWDYGWWSGIPFDASAELYYEGAWTVLADGNDAPNQTHEDLAAYGAELDENGINFVTYILLHDTVGEDGKPTDEYGEFNSLTHPEWFSNQKHPYSKLADLGNEECVEYLKTTLEKFFKNNNVDSWRTDFEPIATYSEQENRHDANGNDVTYWCTVGFTDIIKHLYETVDGFKFESCNSGGSSKDLHHATLATVFNCDDSANYLSLRKSFYDSSYVIHPAQLQFPCNPDTFNPEMSRFSPFIKYETDDETYDFKDAMLDMGFRTVMLGSPMVSSWTDRTAYFDYYTEYYPMYSEKVRPLVREAELYHILPRPDGTNWDGMMYADPDSEKEIKGLVFLFKPSAEVADTQNVVLDGLYGDTVYQLTFEDRPEQNCTATGAELMTKGIDVEIKHIGSELIWITEAE